LAILISLISFLFICICHSKHINPYFQIFLYIYLQIITPIAIAMNAISWRFILNSELPAHQGFIIGGLACVSALLHFSILTLIQALLNDCILGLIYGWSFDSTKYQILHSLQLIVIPSYCAFLWAGAGASYHYAIYSIGILLVLATTSVLIKGGFIDLNLNIYCCFLSCWKLLISIYALLVYILHLQWPLIKVFLQVIIVALCFTTVVMHFKKFSIHSSDYDRDEESVLL
jgi:hypothetical protein